MADQPDKPIFTGRPPGRKLPTGLNPADRKVEAPIAMPEVNLEIVEIPEIVAQPTKQETPAVEVIARAEPKPVAKTTRPQANDRRRHLKTLLAAAGLVTIFGAITGVVLAHAVHGNRSTTSSLPASPVTPENASSPLEPVTAPDVPTTPPNVEAKVKPSLKPTLKPSSRPTTRASSAPEEPVESDAPRSPQIVTYMLKETQSCHAKVSAELQILTNGTWSFLANPDGWDRPAKCPDTNPYQPFVTKELLEGTTIRWRVYSSAWEWFSKPVTLR